jgi:hypothetical protein
MLGWCPVGEDQPKEGEVIIVAAVREGKWHFIGKGAYIKGKFAYLDGETTITSDGITHWLYPGEVPE